MALEKQLLEKIKKYRRLTALAMKKARISARLSSGQRSAAEDFLEMCRNYFSDAEYFEKKGDLLNALAALSYAHAWLDAASRLELIETKGNSRLFALKK